MNFEMNGLKADPVEINEYDNKKIINKYKSPNAISD